MIAQQIEEELADRRRQAVARYVPIIIVVGMAPDGKLLKSLVQDLLDLMDILHITQIEMCRHVDLVGEILNDLKLAATFDEARRREESLHPSDDEVARRERRGERPDDARRPISDSDVSHALQKAERAIAALIIHRGDHRNVRNADVLIAIATAVDLVWQKQTSTPAGTAAAA